MDRVGGKSLPYPVIVSHGWNGDWLGDLDHSVEGVDGDGDLIFLTGCRPCPELWTDDVFVATDRGVHEAASAALLHGPSGGAAGRADIGRSPLV
jgi:hypothetical protein